MAFSMAVPGSGCKFYGGQMAQSQSSPIQLSRGQDTLGAPHRTRYHSDDSIEVKYYDNPAKFADKAAFSLTVDAGCESGSGVSCFGDSKQGPKTGLSGRNAL